MATGYIPTSDGPHIPVEIPAGSTLANTEDINAKNSTQDQAIVAAAWFKGGLLATTPINGPLGGIVDGGYRASTPTRAVELGLPDGMPGEFEQLSSGTFGMHFYKNFNGLYVRSWNSVSNSWGGWVNPAKLAADAAAAGVKWYHGGLLATTPINGAPSGLPDGAWRCTTPTRAVELGLPDGMPGKFEQVSSGTFGLQFYENFNGNNVRSWNSTTGTWGGWVKPSAGGGSTPVESAAASGNKMVPLVLTAGHGGTTYGQTSATVRYPMEWAAPIYRGRVHIRNINPRENQVFTGAVNFPQGLYVGDATTWDGTATNLTQVAAPFSTAENGGDWVSDVIEFDFLPDSKHILSASYVASATVVNNSGACWTATGQVAESTAGTWTQGAMAPFDIWIEVEVPESTPVVAVVGDSLSAGTSSTLPVHDSVMSQYMRKLGGLPIHYAHVGDSMNSYNGGGAAGSETYKKTRWAHLARPDAVLFALGSNDMFGGNASLATCQSRFATTLAWAKSALSPNVYLSTITPRDAEIGAKEDIRRSYNVWLKGKTSPGGDARAVFDFVPAISSDDETIIPALNGDGIHLNTAGYAAEMETLRHLTAPAPVYRAV